MKNKKIDFIFILMFIPLILLGIVAFYFDLTNSFTIERYNFILLFLWVYMIIVLIIMCHFSKKVQKILFEEEEKSKD